MTTFDPDSLEQDPDVLRDIVRRFGGKLALNCAVLRGGTIQVGQSVTLSHPAARDIESTGAKGARDEQAGFLRRRRTGL
jgi:hypothetical protein